MRVKTMMTNSVRSVSPETTLFAALETMSLYEISGLVVVDDSGDLLGIISEGDLVRHFEGDGMVKGTHPWLKPTSIESTAYPCGHVHVCRVADVKTYGAVITIAPGATLGAAAALFEQHHIRCLPVVSDGKLVGIFTRSDFVNAIRMMMASHLHGPAHNTNIRS